MTCSEAEHVFSVGQFLPGRILAAPSWVFPGSLRDNCHFLADRVDEAGLLFFESAPALAYDPEDLPPDLADLPLRYHVHLPSDLPMERPADAASVCVELLGKAAFLRPVCGVLHPPAITAAGGEREARLRLVAFLDAFAASGASPASLLLENTKENDLTCLETLVEDYDLRICLDMGHALAYNQKVLLRHESLLQRTGMIHVSAPGRGLGVGQHLPLTALAPGEASAARYMLRAAPPDAVIMLEMFHWPYIESSLPLLGQWLMEDSP